MLPTAIREGDPLYRTRLPIGHERTCACPPSHANCLTAKEWLRCQLGVWRFAYERRDIRDKSLHPAAFPIALAKRVIALFTHEGELVLDPFAGSGTTLVAAQDLGRNAVGFDLSAEYVGLSARRLVGQPKLFGHAQQVIVQDDARNIPCYLPPETVRLIWTSPPYANLLDRPRANKSRRERKNSQFGRVEQYSHDPADLGTMPPERYIEAIGEIFGGLRPLLRRNGHCVVNVADMWWAGRRIALHAALIDALDRQGYRLKNIIVWDRTNLVNRIGIFGWPSNYITMGTTFEYLIEFVI